MIRSLKTLKFSVILIGFAAACENDPDSTDEPQRTAASESDARETLNQALSQANRCAVALRDNAALSAVLNFFELREGEAAAEDWVEDLIQSFGEAIDDDAIIDERRLDLISRGGSYTWNPTLRGWDFAPSDAQEIRASFPAYEFSLQNDWTLILDQYADTPVRVDDTTYDIPSQLRLRLQDDGRDLWSATGGARFDANRFPVPREATARLEGGGYVATVALTRRTDLVMDFSATIEGSECNASLEGSLRVFNSDYESIEDSDFDRLTFSLSFDSIEALGEIDLESLIAEDDPTNAQINRFVSIEIVSGREKLADLLVAEDGTDGGALVFSSGALEWVEDFTNSFLEQLEADLLERLGRFWTEDPVCDQAADVLNERLDACDLTELIQPSEDDEEEEVACRGAARSEAECILSYPDDICATFSNPTNPPENNSLLSCWESIP